MIKKSLLLFFGLSFFLMKGQENEKAYSYFKKAKQYQETNRDSAYFYFDKALERAKQFNSLTDALAIYTYLIKANANYFDLVLYHENMVEMGEIMQQNPAFDSLENKEYYLRFHLFYRAGYNYKLRKYELAEEYFSQLYQHLHSIQHPSRHTILYLVSIQPYLGNIYLNTGKTELAKNQYYKNIRFLEGNSDSIPHWEYRTTLTRLSLALVFEKTGKHSKAEELIEEAVRYYENLDGKSFRKNPLISAMHLLANNYLLQQKPGKALMVLKRMDEKKLIDPENLKFLKAQYKYKARAFSQNGNPGTALGFYRKALEVTKEYYHTPHHPYLAELYKEMAQILADEHQFGKSFAAIQKALSTLSKDFESKSLRDNPIPKNSLSKLKLAEVLSAKQKILAQAYEFKNNLDYLKSANQTAKVLIGAIDALKPEFESNEDFQSLLEQTYPAFAQMMETAFLLHQKTGDETYLEDAFYFSEKSRAVLLLSAVQKSGATEFAGVPDSVLLKEQQFRASINHLEKKVFKKPGEEKTRDELFRSKTGFHVFLNWVETQYPKYHKLKYRSEVASLKEIQGLLGQDELLLDYYLTENWLYRFTIGKEKVAFERLSFPESFSGKILHFQKKLSHPEVTKIKTLNDLGNDIFKTIVPKLEEGVSSLRILRHGILNYIPFEALYDSEKGKYLVGDYAISYANSATLFKEYSIKKPETSHRVLAFAPGFAGDNSKLGELLYNQKEAKSIGQYFDGKSLLGQKASLDAFKRLAPDFGIIHLATHAIINDKFPDYSYLAFSPSDSLNHLYIQDLYTLNLKTGMVVLSACETGIGKLQKGAGMLSLAQGFNYAGANSLVTTQWKINDKSAVVLMDRFYENLAKGQTKDAALQNAKTAYLKNTEDPMLRHPYFWAGFVLSGNTSPIISGTNDWIWWLGGGLVLIFLTIFVRKRCFTNL